jgi:hypothetical protein
MPPPACLAAPLKKKRKFEGRMERIKSRKKNFKKAMLEFYNPN